MASMVWSLTLGNLHSERTRCLAMVLFKSGHVTAWCPFVLAVAHTIWVEQVAMASQSPDSRSPQRRSQQHVLLARPWGSRGVSVCPA
eukprot:s85_g9.t1